MTFAALVTLGLGVGGNTALFSVIYKTLLEPLPFERPDRLVMLWEHNLARNNPQNVVSLGNYLDWQQRSKTLESMAAALNASFELGGDTPEVVKGQRVTGGWFETLRVRPIKGRVFVEDDGKPNAEPAAVISRTIWERRFGSDPAIAGKQIRFDGLGYTVVGVVDSPFASLGADAEIWAAMRVDPSADNRRGRNFRVVARMADGVTLEAARAEMKSIAAQLEQEHMGMNAKWSANVVALDEQFAGPLKNGLLVLFGAGMAVLVIACVNVANLLMARAAARKREMAVRASLGAGRWRLARQLLVESLLLGALGGAVGLGIATWSIEGLKVLLPENFPRLASVGLQGPVLAFAMLCALGTGVLVGLGAALVEGGRDLAMGLRQGTAGSGTERRALVFRNVLVVAETALTLALLAAAGWFTQSLLHLQSVPTGFDPRNVLTMSVQTEGEQYRDPVKQLAYFEETVRRLNAVPGVESASAITFLPFSGPGSATRFYPIDRPEPAPGMAPTCDVRMLLPGFPKTMRIPVVAGRDFTGEDFAVKGPLRFLINETLARTIYGKENPIGRMLHVNMGQTPETTRGQIIGVLGDIRSASLIDPVRPMVYYPYVRMPFGGMTMVARAKTDVRSIHGAAEAAVRSVDPGRPLRTVRTMEEYLRRATQQPRAQSWLLGSFSGLTLLLTVVGVGGVLMLSVTQNLRELGIRLALGAQPRALLARVVWQGLALIAVGSLIGLAITAIAGRFAATLLHGITPTDPGTLGTAIAVLVCAGAVASLIPAIRAMRVDPMRVLREE